MKSSIFIDIIEQYSIFISVCKTYTFIKSKKKLKTQNKIFLIIFLLIGIVVYSQNSPPYKNNSVLKDGSWYKIAVSNDGVYKIDYDFINSDLNINPSNVHFDKFGVFGQAMGILPEANSAFRVDDLEEIAIKIKDFNNNNVWDSNDYILFYAKGPHIWSYDEVLNKYKHTYNIYTNEATYFISTNRGTGKTFDIEISPSTSSATITKFEEHLFFEEDINNLLYTELAGAAGSGRVWYGQKLDNISPTQEINFTIPDFISSEQVQITARLASGPVQSNGNFQVKNNGAFLFSYSPSGGLTGTYNDMADVATSTGNYSLPSGNISLELKYINNTPNTKGWLDYIEIIAKRRLNLNSSFLIFRNSTSLNYSISKYRISNANSSTEIWDISTASDIKKIQTSLSGSNLEFSRISNTLKEFVAVNTSATNFEKPSFVEKIENQNLHHLANTDYIIITISKFKPAAEKLADFHREKNNLDVTIVMLDQIYNEFSSGQQDVSAIRDFLRMFYKRNLSEEEKLKYVLLFGDASFDYKDRLDNNQNIIPTFQSRKHLSTVKTFCTDDYYAMLEDNEGANVTASNITIDLALGRFPINTEEEAMAVVDKIIYYKTNKSTSAWKNELTFIADDEDNNIHINDIEEVLAINGIERENYYNIDKIYIDTYKQHNSAGGDRYPDVVDAILRKLFTGTFFMNYAGHGGPTNWAQERILNIQDINELKNKDKLPVFMTATCDFAPFDDPKITSAGEALFLNPEGGAIAMFSTTRLVFASENKKMNKAIMNYFFQEVNGRMPTTGEILMQAKNEAPSTDNNRKFVLLGDPALTLEYPKYEIVTTKINNTPILQTDTLKALSRVSFEGGVMDNNGALMTDFNGIVYAKVFDKEATYKTKANDAGSSEREFQLQNNVIFKGKASVKNGKFKFEFIVPKDINYSFGKGKVTYYAEQANNQNIDAQGFSKNFIIGGTATNVEPDDEGPEVEIFMNDSSFAFGGLTDENPVLLVSLKDKSGINTVGNGVGHDLVATLNDDSQNQYLLNDFYESALDDFTKGNVIYLLNNLKDGLHQIKVKAWDVHNNPGEGYTEFVVASSAQLTIEHVLNYPNPFTTNTSFIFEHNHPDDLLMVTIQIYTVSGRIVKTIRQQVQSNGFRIARNQITWNGQDDYGDFIGRGVYLYKVNVEGSNGFRAYKFEKLVILK